MSNEAKNSYQHRENVILTKSKAFAVNIVRLCQSLQGEKREFVLSKQVLRSGTSIGANAKEAINGASNKDFGNKMTIALKEAGETEYWLEILFETGYISVEQFDNLIAECRELIKILTAILNTLKKSLTN
ncbi:MAG: four helix bundle protein [Bacteroidales bacterium]|nr:four helix bundle protein [Bacteroidales bacterium]MBQ1694785.1 four helix bundle protein [Bacteroidales bacterium]MBQ1732369.1 four helix bundle protein [Bacteroidales bacterium]MBQ2076096.1 four helix bundle protein [Bacteroidales bacterium]MBQ2352196.1 four helix bundle protein [Bacteroidales bacterium]